MNNLGDDLVVSNQGRENGESIITRVNFNTEYLKYHNNVPMAVFTMDEFGPKVIFDDFANISKIETGKSDVGISLQKLAITYVAALGMGHEYHEGVFDLPGTGFTERRILLISFRLINPSASDNRLKNGYYQIALFVDKKDAKNFPSCSYMEDDIIEIIKRFVPTADYLTPEIIGFVKELIFDSIREKLQKNGYTL